MKKLFLLLSIFAFGQVEEASAQVDRRHAFLQQLSGSSEEAPYVFTYVDDPNGIVVKSRAKTGYKIYLRFETAGDTVVVTRWY